MRSLHLSSGSLLSLLCTALLCGSGAHRTYAGQQNRVKPASKPRSGAKQVALLTVEPQTAPQEKQAPKEIPKTQIGDVKISGATTSGAGFGTREFRFKGPNTEIEVPDKTSQSVLYVHADDIQGSPVGKIDVGLIILNGNVRYRVVQKIDGGERILEGTAGHAEIRRTTKRMNFTGGVRATLTDGTQFSGPATLRTGTLNVAMDAKPYRYTLEGAATTNDVKFTPLQTPKTPKGAKPGAAAPVGAVHVFGFRSGDLQFGQAIHLKGVSTTCDFASPDEKTSWHLQGEEMEGEFVPGTSDLQRATVMENVKFHITQPTADKKSKTTADGTAPQASYVRSEAGQELITHGPFNIAVTDPVHLEEPATIVATKGAATLSLKKAGDNLSYMLDDPSQTSVIHILPKPFEENETKPAVLPGPK